MNSSAYITVTTQYFKTHFAQLVRDIEKSNELEGIKVTNHGRLLGIFLVNK